MSRLKKLKRLLLSLTLAAAFTVLPLSAAAETTEVINEKNLVITGDDIDSTTISDRELSKGIVQVCIGYLFDDGSYDIWFTAPGFAVNNRTVITSSEATVSVNGNVYQTALNDRNGSYNSLGIDLSDYNEVTSHLVYRVYNGGENLLSAVKLSDAVSNGHFTVLQVNGLLGAYYKVYDGSVTQDLEFYAIGAIEEAVDPSHILESSDIIEQTIEVSDITAADQILFTEKASEYFAACPIVNQDGTITGFVEAYDPAGQSIACTASVLRGVLNAINVNYEVTGLIDRSTDFSYLDSVIDALERTDKDTLTKKSAALYDEIYSNAVALRTNENAAQDEVDAMVETARTTIQSLKHKNTGKVILVIVMVLVAGAAFGYGAMKLILFLKSRRVPEPFADEEEALEDIVPEKKSWLKNWIDDLKDLIAKKKSENAEKEKKVEKKPEKKPEKKLQKKQEKKPVIPEPEELEEPDYEAASEPTVQPDEEADDDSIFRRKPDKRKIKSPEPEEPEITDLYQEEEEDETPTMILETPDTYAIKVERTGELAVINEIPFIIGKSQKVALTLTNETVSRKHVAITMEDDKYYIVDFKSLNGSVLNGEHMELGKLYELHDGDNIVLSDEKLRFVKLEEG